MTGIGCVSPNGMGAEAFASACLAGRSGIAAPDGIDVTGLKTSAVAQVRGFDPASVMDPVEARRVPRMVHLALAASREALESAQLRMAPDDIEARFERATEPAPLKDRALELLTQGGNQ